MKSAVKYIPITLILISLVLSVFSHFGFYSSSFYYLKEFFSYSIFTGVFMVGMTFNKHYCKAVKISVGGLLLLNIFNLIYMKLGINGDMYDIIVATITLLMYTFYKLQKIK